MTVTITLPIGDPDAIQDFVALLNDFYTIRTTEKIDGNYVIVLEARKINH